MAWNQPGGNGGRDPWGDRGSRQGPPDLDEVLKKFQRRLSALLRSGGGGGKGRGGGFGASFGPAGAGVIAVVLLIAWIVAGVHIVQPAEEGVVLRFGAYQRTVGPGPQWIPPFIEHIDIVNVAQIRREEIGFRSAAGANNLVPSEALMLTGDENIIDVKFVVQFRVKNARDYLYNVVDPEVTVRQVTESAVREIVGRSKMDFVLTDGRAAVASEAEALIQKILDRYGAGVTITSVNMQGAQPPSEVQAAFSDAVKAREDEVRLTNEARAYAADLLPKAHGEASAILENAQGYEQQVVAEAEGRTARFLSLLAAYRKAPAITRERMYLDTMQDVLGKASKVIVDLPGSNNLIYLPLDRLGAGRSSTGDEKAPVPVPKVTPPAGGATSALDSNDSARSRGSDTGRNR